MLVHFKVKYRYIEDSISRFPDDERKDLFQSMEPEQFNLTIITPGLIVLETLAEEIVLSGDEGELAILPDHSNILSLVRPGELRITRNQIPTSYSVGTGILEFKDNSATLLVATAELPEEVDVDRAQSALDRARGRLTAYGDKDIDLLRARRSFDRAMARLKAAAAGKTG